MSGFGAGVLAHTPKMSPGLPVRGIQAEFDAAAERVPTAGTVRVHLRRLKDLGLVQESRAGREVRYWRLVDSVLDSPREASV